MYDMRSVDVLFECVRREIILFYVKPNRSWNIIDLKIRSKIKMFEAPTTNFERND